MTTATHTSTSKRRVLVNSASGVIRLLVNLFFVLWLYQFLIARIPPERFSIYPVLITLMMLVPVTISFFGSALGRGVVAAYAEGDLERVTRLHTSAVLMVGGVSSAIFALGVLLSFFIGDILSVPSDFVAEAQFMVVLFMADVAVVVFTTPFSVAFEAKQRFVERDALILLSGFFRIGLTCALLFGVSVSVVWLPLAALISDLVLLALMAWRTRVIAPECRVRWSVFSWLTARSLLVFGLWTSLGSIASVVRQAAGPYILGVFGTAQEVNNYFIGTVIDRRVFAVMTVALGPILPVLTEMSVTRDSGAVARTYVRGGRYSLWLSMAAGAPFVVFSKDIMQLYVGPDFNDAAVISVITVAAFPAIFSSIMLSRVAIATGELRRFFVGAFFATMLAVLAAVFAVTVLDTGPIGMTAAMSGVAVTTTVVYFWPLGMRLASVPAGVFARETLVLGLTPALAGILVWYTVSLLGDVRTWSDLIVQVIPGGLAYLAVLYFACLNEAERGAIDGWRKRR